MNDKWEMAWETVNYAFQHLAQDLNRSNSALWWTCGHTDNEVFPFRAYAAFNKAGVAGDEDVVIALDFQRRQQTISFTSDISTGSGEILAEGPSGSLLLATDDAKIRSWVTDSTAEFTAFVNSNRAVLMRELTAEESGKSHHEP